MGRKSRSLDSLDIELGIMSDSESKFDSEDVIESDGNKSFEYVSDYSDAENIINERPLSPDAVATITNIVGNTLWFDINGCGYMKTICCIEDWMKVGKQINIQCKGSPGEKGFSIISIYE